MKDPSTHHPLERKNYKITYDPKPTGNHPRRPRSKVSERSHAITLCFPPDVELCQHNRNAYGKNTRNINKDKSSPSVLTRNVRKSPYVSQPDGRADGGEHKSDDTGLAPSLCGGGYAFRLSHMN